MVSVTVGIAGALVSVAMSLRSQVLRCWGVEVLGGSGRNTSIPQYLCCYHTLPVSDMILELRAEILHRSPLVRPGGGIAEGAKAAAVHHPLAAQARADVHNQ